MTELILKLLGDLLNDSLMEIKLHGSTIDDFVNSFSDTAFYVEKMIGAVINTSLLTNMYTVVQIFGIGLIVLKFLKKGFDTYTLWTDGDPDADPIMLLTNFFKAIAVSMSFLFMYEWVVDAAKSFLTDLLSKVIATSTGPGMSSNEFVAILQELLLPAVISSSKIIIVIIILVYGFLLYFQFMKRGIEMFVLRLGMPLACVGLLDSDKGVFKPYMQKFFQSAITVVVQAVLAKIGLMVLVNHSYLWAIAILSLALSTPRFLQEFMLVGGGGGGISNVFHVTSMARGAASSVAKIFRK